MKRISALITWHGAKSALYKVVAGDGAGRYDLQNWHASLEVGANSFLAYGVDAEYQAVMQEGVVDPVADVVGPWLDRMLYVAPKGVKPIVVHRDYHVSIYAVPKAMELAPKLEALMTEIDVEVGIGLPVMKDDHEILRVVYRFNSMTHWGQSVDKMIADYRFVSLVNETDEPGTLQKSWMLALVR